MQNAVVRHGQGRIRRFCPFFVFFRVHGPYEETSKLKHVCIDLAHLAAFSKIENKKKFLTTWAIEREWFFLPVAVPSDWMSTPPIQKRLIKFFLIRWSPLNFPKIFFLVAYSRKKVKINFSIF